MGGERGEHPGRGCGAGKPPRVKAVSENPEWRGA